MNELSLPSTRSGIGRRLIVVLAGFLSLAVAGATDPARSPEVPPQVVAALANRFIPPSINGDAELMHDINLRTTAIGMQPPLATNPTQNQQGRILWMEVTAYCGCTKCCGANARGITASGRSVVYNDGHFVAADTRVLPFGTQLQIPGYADEKPVEVIDRGGAIKGNHIDVFFPNHEQAMDWGRRWIGVTVGQ